MTFGAMTQVMALKYKYKTKADLGSKGLFRSGRKPSIWRSLTVSVLASSIKAAAIFKAMAIYLHKSR